MNRTLSLLFSIILLSAIASAQQKRAVQRPPAKPAAAVKSAASTAIDRGTVLGRTYTNRTFKFEVTFPDSWLIPGDADMKSKGVDLSLKAPQAASLQAQETLDSALKRLTVLMTVYREMPGTPDNAVVRIAVEDIKNLNTMPPVRDAVDYVDLLRQTYKIVKIPADFRYSETQAEQLGHKQFAFIDTSGKEGKTRLYATVRNGFAILFTLYYNRDKDLQTFRDVLAKGNFSLK